MTYSYNAQPVILAISLVFVVSWTTDAAPRKGEMPMTSEQSSAAAQTTRMVIDRFNEAFNQGET